MNIRTHTLITILAGALVAATTHPAFSQEDGRDHGAYLGIRFMGSSLHLDNDDADFFIKDDGGGFTLLGGYSFNEVFSLELDIVGVRHDTSNPEIDARMGGAMIFAHYRFAPGNDFRPYIKGGVGGYGLELDAGDANVHIEGGGVPIGGGFDYFFSPHFSLGADFTHNIIKYEELHVDLGDVDVAFDVDEEGSMSSVGLSLTYYF
jgi:opacity protein-like surface antigen